LSSKVRDESFEHLGAGDVERVARVFGTVKEAVATLEEAAGTCTRRC
jgi:hypothetical protein